MEKIEVTTEEYATLLNALIDAITWTSQQKDILKNQGYSANIDTLDKQIKKYENMYTKLQNLSKTELQ